jgi:hypothetical protein
LHKGRIDSNQSSLAHIQESKNAALRKLEIGRVSDLGDDPDVQESIEAQTAIRAWLGKHWLLRQQVRAADIVGVDSAPGELRHLI